MWARFALQIGFDYGAVVGSYRLAVEVIRHENGLHAGIARAAHRAHGARAAAGWGAVCKEHSVRVEVSA
jgi:hypothetical protein